MCRRSVACLIRLLFSTVFRGHMWPHVHPRPMLSALSLSPCRPVNTSHVFIYRRELEKQFMIFLALADVLMYLSAWLRFKLLKDSWLIKLQVFKIPFELAPLVGQDLFAINSSKVGWTCKNKTPFYGYVASDESLCTSNLHSDAITHSMCWLHSAVYEALDSLLT